MATNFEFYRDEILAISEEEKGIALVSNKPVPCEDTDCTACDFKGYCPEYRLIQWLYAEHIEPPKLTKRERAFCEAVQTGWIARDCDMELCYFKNEPILLKGVWSSQDGRYVSFRELNLQDPFMFIRDTDADCWSVEDLLRLEVMEEGKE